MALHSSLRWFPFCLVLALLSACSLEPKVGEAVVANIPIQVHTQTVIPKEFPNQISLEPQGDVVVPAAMLELLEVAHRRAEVRIGPGSHYELSDVVLAQGTRVIETGAFGVWRKVLVLGTWQEGWVHSQVLGANRGSGAVVSVAMRHLPTVLVIHPVIAARAYDNVEPLAVAIARGTQFRELRRDESASLVYLPQTNSALWLSRKDVR